MSRTARQIALEFLAVAWRLALYFVLLIAAFRLLSLGYGRVIHRFGVHFAEAPGVKPAEAVFFGQVRLLIAAIVAWLVTARLGRDRLGPILPFNATAGRHLVQGTLWGFAAIALLIGAMAGLGGYRISGVALPAADLLYYVILWLAVALVNGAAENLALMGYPLFRVVRSAGWPLAILLSSALFAAAHLGNPGENPLGIASVFLIALVMATTIWLTGDLWLSIGIHAGIIIAEDLVFSAPDSGATYTGHLLSSQFTGPAWLTGGQAGPEGSLLAFPVFLILLGLLWRLYRRPRSSAPGE